jgi:DNA mismatch repair protein MSH5
VNGLSLESHAARCAELFGVPSHVVQRAQYVTYAIFRRLKGDDLIRPSGRELLSAHELPKLLDEAILEEEQLDMDLASAVSQRFLEWDLEEEAPLGEVREKLTKVIGRDVDRSDDE